MKKTIVDYIRLKMLIVAGGLNKLSKGKIKPNHITLLSLIGHIPVSLALVANEPIIAAILLAFFASLDSLDGALARVQKSSSLSGMYFDAVSDRVKEIIIFSALAVYMNNLYTYDYGWLVVAVLGSSILVSYTKAKGEMAISDTAKSSDNDTQKLNQVFSGGISSYEIRVILIVLGLLFTVLPQVLVILLFTNLYTSLARIKSVSASLHNPKFIEKSGK